MLKKVLVVDDSALIHQMYKMVLMRYRCKVVDALNGQEALDKLEQNPDVDMMLVAAAKEDEEATLQGMEFRKGDRVKIKEGSFQNFEGSVDSIDEQKGIVTVLLTIFGRSTPVDVEYWQLEKV